MSETKKQAQEPGKTYEYLVDEWRALNVAIDRERRRVGSNRRIVLKLQAEKKHVEALMRKASGHDPEDDSQPPF